MASAIDAASTLVCINPAAVARCRAMADVSCWVTEGSVSPCASRRRLGIDRKVMARSLGDVLLIGQSWQVSTRSTTRPIALITMFDGKFRASVDRAVKPVGTGLERTGMSPDHL